MDNKVERTSSTIDISSKSTSHLTSRKKGYTDIDLRLTLHPFRKDIVPLKDAEAVKNAVKNLVLTNFFERPFQPNLGANLKALLFEPMDSITEIALRENIEDVILENEPRIRLVKITVKGNIDNNNYDIRVKYIIKQTNEIGQVSIVLRRLR